MYGVRPRAGVKMHLASQKSAFAAPMRLPATPAPSVTPARVPTLNIQAKRICQMTGKKRMRANAVCFSNKKHRKFQQVNLHNKKMYWERAQRMVKMKLSTEAIRTIKRKGLENVALENGVDLWKLPYEDVSDARLEWKAQQPKRPPMSRKGKMKDPAKLAKSKKPPYVPEYCFGHIRWVRSEAQPAGQ